MLYRNTFICAVTMFTLPLDRSPAEGYLCNCGGIVSPFLSRVACGTLNLAGRHGITHIAAYILTNVSVETYYLLQEWIFSEWHLLLFMAQAIFQI